MWFQKSQEEALTELQVEASRGLSNEEVQKRREKYGEKYPEYFI